MCVCVCAMNCNDLNGVVALRQHPLSNVEITAQRKTQLCYAQHVTTHPSWSLSAFVWQPGLQGFHQGGCMRLIALVLPRTKWPETSTRAEQWNLQIVQRMKEVSGT